MFPKKLSWNIFSFHLNVLFYIESLVLTPVFALVAAAVFDLVITPVFALDVIALAVFALAVAALVAALFNAAANFFCSAAIVTALVNLFLS
jgi:hypothetical protein